MLLGAYGFILIIQQLQFPYIFMILLIIIVVRLLKRDISVIIPNKNNKVRNFNVIFFFYLKAQSSEQHFLVNLCFIVSNFKPLIRDKFTSHFNQFTNS